MPSDDQVELQLAVRETAAKLLPPERLRELANGDPWSEPVWRALAELGVHLLRVPAERGGLGLGMAESALVFEELGRSLAPGPLLETHLATTYGLVPPETQHPAVSMAHEDGRLVLVPFADHAQYVVRVTDRLRMYDTADLELAPVARPLDPLTPWHRLLGGFPDAQPAPSTESAEWDRDVALLTAAQQVGLAQGVLEKTVEHVRHREQFGAVVGSRQAVKHRLADMLVRVAVARAGVLAAAVACDEATEPLARPVASAKVLADRAAVQNGLAAVQLHGAMGFAWETTVHLYLKRAWVLAQQGGTRAELELTLATLLGADSSRVDRA